MIADAGESSGAIGEEHRAPTVADVQRILDRRGPGGIVVSDPVWMSSFTINERKVEDYRAGRVFLVGDAAHVHSPAGGQGMNTGMQDAYNLAWKLALVTRGICAEEPLLTSYSTERSAVAKLVLDATGKATAMAVMKGGIKQAIRNHIASLLFGFAPVRETMANVLSEEAVGYTESPLNAKTAHAHDGPKAGKRAPVRRGEQAVGAGDTPRFALFADKDGMPGSLMEKNAKWLESALRKPYHESGIWLVRPDGYVALSAKAGNWGEVERYFGDMLGARD